MRYSLVFLLFLGATMCSLARGEPSVDGGGTPLRTWQDRERTIGWGNDKHAPVLRVKDSDRESPARLRPEWIEWRKSMGSHRTFQNWTDEELHARIFEESEVIVSENQAAFARDEVTYQLAINHLADITEEEFDCMTMGPATLKDDSIIAQFNESRKYTVPRTNLNAIPHKIDWRNLTVIQPVKNQGGCGSCYSFAAVGAYEAHMSIWRMFPLNLSEQYAMDCSTEFGNGGCSGGWMHKIYNWLRVKKRGLRTADDIPYNAWPGKCPDPSPRETFTLSTFVLLPESDENVLRDEVAQVGPVATAIHVGRHFQMYSKGIYNDPNCREPRWTNNKHAVVVIGYGSEKGEDYWILRNSWAATWGEQGYMRMKRGVNMCKIPIAATYPVF